MTDADPSNDVFTITYAHGSTSTFAAIHKDVADDWVYRITEFADRYDNAVEYVYDGEGYLTEIRGDMYDPGSPDLYRLVIAYNAHGRVATITDYADYSGQSSVIGGSYTDERVWEFVYNSDAQLTEIKLPKTQRYDSETKGSAYRTRVQFTYVASSDRMEEVIDARQANESSPIGWLKNHYDGSSRVDYQDVGRTSGGDTTHRQHVIYSSIDGNGRWTADVVNAEGLRSRFQVQVQSGSYPIGTTVYVRHYTAFWNSSLSQTSGKLRSGDPDYYETAFDYDSELNTIEVTYPRGNRSEFRYDITGDQRERGNLLRALSHPGSISTSGLPADQVNGLLATFTYTGDFNLLATSVSPRGYNVGASYDITNHSGLTTDDSSRFTTTYTYFDGSAPGTLAGTLQKVTSPAVDDADSPDTLNDTQVIEVDYTYNSFGQLETVTDEAGVETTYVYGTSGFGKGYLVEIQAGSQATALETAFTYNSVGRVIAVTDPRGFTYTSYVNQLDQVVRSETPQVSYHGNAVYYSITDYDLNGNVETAGVSNFDKSGTLQSPNVIETSYAWNILDMATSITEDIDVSTTRTTTVSYDKIYRATETVLPEGNRSGTDFDEINRVFKTYWGYDGTAVTRANALTKTRADYDLNSNVTRAEDGRGNDSHYTYDAYDRLAKAEDRLASNANYTSFAYNRAGQALETARYGKKRTHNPGTDTYGWTNDLLLAKAETRYDNMGRAYFSRTLAKDAAGTADLDYSAYESVPTGADDGWSTCRVQFRSNGQVEFTEGDLRYQTKYEYDDYNRLEAVIDDRDGGGPDKLDDDNYDFYDYDLNGNVVGITAYLYDDAGSGGDKVLATSFTYDSLNRLVEDEAPYPSGSGYTREYRYDSRGNRVFTVDRKGVERVYGYDLLDRPIRAEISDVEYRDISPSTGYVTTSVRDIVSRTVYDKNSNVKESIGPTGSRSYVRYDLAHRWLQTQYPDGGSGTPLKSSAGSGHSLTTVSGTPYYTKSGAYDGNGNLLLSTDANNTEITFTWDANDNLLEETGSAAGGNPFGIIGEAGMEYEYDGMYRAGRGRTNDGSDDLTEVNSLFNSLSGIERQQQIVYDAHPGLSTPYTSTGTVQSWFDESGRRYQRQNPSGVTRTAWHFDRKHRPVETWRSVNVPGSGWQTDSDPISEYDYLGGGLLHSRHLKRHPQDPNRPIVSTFQRDDLLRVTSVRHTREDSGFAPRLLGRFDTAYDENSMMLYEARWYEEDDNGSSTTPDATDFYFYDSANKLEKATYGVTQDDTGGSAPLDLSSIHWPNVNTNDVTHSDRVIYSRRHTGTRERVNWYRGSADPTDPIPGQFDESSNGPTQKTDYDTSDDPGADPDNPASDGEGSRNNYTEIGNVGLTYDNNRNLQADGTREFRYNYRNQLRKVWRKSDGDSDGLVSQYREDAFGRRVLTHSWWELARRVYLDTRFELDIDMDADGDSTEMEYVNGGITSTASAPMSHPHQLAEWESRIHRTHATLESHYYDFLVYIPDVDVGTYIGDVYRGMVGVGDYELLIYHDRYELWDFTGSPTLLDTSYATTSGWHNIGLRAGIDAGVWVDGSQIMSYGVGLYINEKVKFGTLHNSITYMDGEQTAVIEAEGIELYENLNYLRSYNRSQVTHSDPPGGGHLGGTGGYPNPDDPGPPFTAIVDVTLFDNVQPITKVEIIAEEGFASATEHLMSDVEGDPTRVRYHYDGGEYTDLRLPNANRGTGVVVRDNADMLVNDEGTLVEDTENGPHPGVALRILHAADGSVNATVRTNPASASGPDPRDGDTGDHAPAPTYVLKCTATLFGVAEPASDKKTTTTSNPRITTTEEPALVNIDIASSSQLLSGSGPCACNSDSVNLANMTTATVEPTTNFIHDYFSGDAEDAELDSATSMGPPPEFVTWEQDGQTWAARAGGGEPVMYRVRDTSRRYSYIDEEGNTRTAIDLTDNLEKREVISFFGLTMVRSGTDEGCQTAVSSASWALDGLGFIPIVGEVADGANVLLLGATGDELGAILSAISMIPIVGDIIGKGAKIAIKGGRAAIRAMPWHKLVSALMSFAGECGTDRRTQQLIQSAIDKLKKFLDGEGVNWCFPAGTMVKTVDGEKPIEEIKPGDYVWAWDENTGSWILERVEAISVVGFAGELVVLVTDDGELNVTPDHPFHVVAGRALAGRDASVVNPEYGSDGPGIWVRAGVLTRADVLMTRRGSGTAIVREVKTRTTRLNVYNLVVRRVHNYLVGAQGVVVHNGTGTCTPNGPAGDAGDAAAGGGKAGDTAGNGKPANGSSTGAPAVQKGPIPDQAPSNLAEQLALKEAKANGGTKIMKDLADAPRLKANYGDGEWVKMEHVHRGSDGKNTVVHWFQNTTTGQNVEYKFK
ncbi:MAG: hypothetical protein IT464_03345 [Planctomycetes bacterium]|nr:hypothetical protein [Planctomycetota bacterium]